MGIGEATGANCSGRGLIRETRNLLDAAVAIKKLLRCAGWSFVQFLFAFDETEFRAKFAVKFFRVVTHHI